MKRVESLVFAGVFLGIAGCNNPPTDQQIQQKAAQTTQQVKEDAQQAASRARTAAATAEDKINAVAAGVKQGLGTPSTPINLNTAGTQQLETLPGISPAKARRIIAGRPYTAPGDLVSRKILTNEQYDPIADKVVVQ